jgi:hypothetical protein
MIVSEILGEVGLGRREFVNLEKLPSASPTALLYGNV